MSGPVLSAMFYAVLIALAAMHDGTGHAAKSAVTKVETTLQVDLSMIEGKCIASFPPLLMMSVPGDLHMFFKGWRDKSIPIRIWFDRRVPKQCASLAAEAARRGGFGRVSVDWNHKNYPLPPW